MGASGDTLGLRPETTEALHNAAVRRNQSHNRVLEALKKAGAKDDTIRRVEEAVMRSSTMSSTSTVRHSERAASTQFLAAQHSSDQVRHTVPFMREPHVGAAKSYTASDDGFRSSYSDGMNAGDFASTIAQADAKMHARSMAEAGGYGGVSLGAPHHIGCMIEKMRTGEHVIINVKHHGPAAHAGIHVGSIIRAVDGFDVLGQRTETVRSLIMGPRETFVTLTICPPGAHHSFIEDVVVMRNEEPDDLICMDPKCDHSQDDVVLKEGARKEGMWSWMNGIMCWGPREKSEAPAARASQLPAPGMRGAMPPSAPLACAPSVLSSRHSEPKPHAAVVDHTQTQRPVTMPALASARSEELHDGIMRVKRKTELTAMLLENLVKGIKSPTGSLDYDLLLDRMAHDDHVAQTKSIHSPGLSAQTAHGAGASFDRFQYAEPAPPICRAMGAGSAYWNYLYGTASMPQLSARSLPEPEKLRDAREGEGKQILWENLRDLEFTVQRLAHGDTPSQSAPDDTQATHKDEAPAPQVKREAPPQQKKETGWSAPPPKSPDLPREITPEQLSSGKGLTAHPPKLADAVPKSPLHKKFETYALGTGKFIVHVKQGRGLKKMDVLTGMSDPFCVLTLGQDEKKTRVIKESVDPVWDEEFSFNLDLQSGPDCLIVQVFDWNMVMKNHLIAEATIGLRDVRVNPKGISGDMWFTLTRSGPKKKEDYGSILLQFETTHPTPLQGRTYYMNNATGETQWHFPGSGHASARDSRTPPPEPKSARGAEESPALPTPPNYYKSRTDTTMPSPILSMNRGALDTEKPSA